MIYDIGEEPRDFHHPSPRFVCLVRVDPKYKRTGDLEEKILLVRQEGKWGIPSGRINEIPVHAIRTFLDKELGFMPSLDEFGPHKHYLVVNESGNFLYLLAQVILENKPVIRMGEDVSAYMWVNRKAFLNVQLIPGENITLGDAYGINQAN